MKTFIYPPFLPFAGNHVRTAWGTEQEYDYNYNSQRISQYRRVLGVVDGYESVSSMTNSVARKSHGTNDVGRLILDGVKIGGHIANGLGYGMTRANLLQLRQEIENQSIIRGYYTPTELQQLAEIDKMTNECREKSNKNLLLGFFMSACLFGVSLYSLLKTT